MRSSPFWNERDSRKSCAASVEVQSGLSDVWWSDAMERDCYLRNVQHFHRVCPAHRRRMEQETCSSQTGEPEKTVASEVHMKSFASQGVDADTCRGTCTFPCADGSVKQEGHVVPRPPRLRRPKTPSTSQLCGRGRRMGVSTSSSSSSLLFLICLYTKPVQTKNKTQHTAPPPPFEIASRAVFAFV